MNAKLKICGMKVPDNISSTIALQPDYMGFIFYPGSKRFVAYLDPEVLRNIPQNIKTTGVFVDQDLEDVKKVMAAYQLKAVQLHGNESPDYCKSLLGEAEVIKAFGIDEEFDFNTLTPYADAVNYFLFDTQTRYYGGSGKSFSWQLLQNYTLTKPYFLSGGIGLDSVPELQLFTDERLYAIDVNSRFETAPGLKNIEELSSFKTLLAC